MLGSVCLIQFLIVSFQVSAGVFGAKVQYSFNTRPQISYFEYNKSHARKVKDYLAVNIESERK